LLQVKHYIQPGTDKAGQFTLVVREVDNHELAPAAAKLGEKGVFAERRHVANLGELLRVGSEQSETVDRMVNPPCGAVPASNLGQYPHVGWSAPAVVGHALAEIEVEGRERNGSSWLHDLEQSLKTILSRLEGGTPHPRMADYETDRLNTERAKFAN